MSARERILASPDDPAPAPTAPPRRDDVIVGLLMGAQANLAAAMALLRQPERAADASQSSLADPSVCEHPMDRVVAVGGFGDEPQQRFCSLCGTEWRQVE